MTERKFTDEEVIKALECCLNEDCENCPARTCCDDDTESFVKYVFDLITRLEAENRSLISEVNSYRQEVERLQNEQTIAKFEKNKDLANAKVEAVKEFAERLKDKLLSKGFYPVIFKNSMQEVYEEMTEGENENKSC